MTPVVAVELRDVPVAPPHVGVGVVFRCEVVKLAAQLRTRATLVLALVAPAVVVAVLAGQHNPPKDTLYGRWVHDSGYAMPLLVLGFAAQWVLPLLTSIVAGDVFASEDAHGTWKTLLTRSAGRASVFWGKTLAAASFACTALAAMALSTIVASLVVVGTQPLPGLSGQLIAPATALRLVVLSWVVVLAPLLGFTALAILLSVRTRNPAVGVAGPLVLGFAMQLLGSLGNVDLLRRLLLTTGFESWHGLFVQPRFFGLLVQGLLVSAAWTAVCLWSAYRALSRRDVSGG